LHQDLKYQDASKYNLNLMIKIKLKENKNREGFSYKWIVSNKTLKNVTNFCV
jgi:hypothetical protein